MSTLAGDKQEGIPTPCGDMGREKQSPKGGGNIVSPVVTPSYTALNPEPDPTTSDNGVVNCEQNVPIEVFENSMLLSTNEDTPKNYEVNNHDVNKVVINEQLGEAVPPVLREQGDHTNSSYNDNEK